MKSHRPLAAALLTAALLAASGCAHSRVRRVWVAPPLQLQRYQSIGLIQLSSVSRPDLAEMATQKLEQAIQAAQPGTPILELGPEKSVLKAVGRQKLDFEAITAIGDHYRVGAVLVGTFEVGRVTPSVHLSPTWHSLSAGASAQASLTAKLFETQGGASVWTRSAQREAPVARIAANSVEGLTGFGMTDPNQAYAALVQGLVGDVTGDFWGHWENREER